MSNNIRCSRRYLTAAVLVISLIVTISWSSDNAADRAAEYVGSDRCRGCHESEYENFIKYAKKAKSFDAVERMKNGLSEEELKGCYLCHTTGYGKPGGFVSAEKTPSMKNTGCEVCHGPGGIHIRTKNPRDIKTRLKKEDCEVCHTQERVKEFRYKPLIHGYAH